MDSTEDDAAEVGIHEDVATVSEHLALEASDMADDESYGMRYARSSNHIRSTEFELSM
jgi:hypothetical protein